MAKNKKRKSSTSKKSGGEKKQKLIPRMLKELDMTFKSKGKKSGTSSDDIKDEDKEDLQPLLGRDTDVMMTESGPGEDDMEEDIESVINNYTLKTRGQKTAAKQFAMEAGIIPQAGTQAASSSATPDVDSDAMDVDRVKDEDDDDVLTFNKVPKPRDHWPDIGRDESKNLWLSWDVKQDKLNNILNSHQYTLNATIIPYPDLFKDLCSRKDFEDNDASPRTFEPEMKHFQKFELMLTVLQEYAKGRAVGFVKIKLPEEAMSTPMVPAAEYENLMINSHHCRLKRVHKHPTMAAENYEGIYKVIRSNESNDDPVVVWRAIMADYDRDTLAAGGELPSTLEFSQEEMLGGIEGEDNNIFSFDNEATDVLRASLRLKNPNLTLLDGNILRPHFPRTKLHISAAASVTRPLFTSPIGAYSLHYLHRGAPVSWTIIDPQEHPHVSAYIHAITHTYGPHNLGAGISRPRVPPQCTASVNHAGVYVSHDRLLEWDMGWTAFEQRAGELVVLAPFTLAQYYWNECGVMEEGVWGSEGWKRQVRGKGVVVACKGDSCGGGLEWSGDLRGL